MKALRSFDTSGPTDTKRKKCHLAEEMNSQQQCCQKLRFRHYHLRFPLRTEANIDFSRGLRTIWQLSAGIKRSLMVADLHTITTEICVVRDILPLSRNGIRRGSISLCRTVWDNERSKQIAILDKSNNLLNVKIL
jgi:hypothetical protein